MSESTLSYDLEHLLHVPISSWRRYSYRYLVRATPIRDGSWVVIDPSGHPYSVSDEVFQKAFEPEYIGGDPRHQYTYRQLGLAVIYFLILTVVLALLMLLLSWLM
jgi:hypothetical protein